MEEDVVVMAPEFGRVGKVDSVLDSYEEQEFWMTKLDWVGIRLNQFEMCETHENCYHGKTRDLKTEHVYKRGDIVLDSYEEQEFWMTKLDWVGIRLNQFEMCETYENCLSRWKQCCSSWKQWWMKTMYK